MQKKNDSFLEKIVKKDYNNELEAVLEKKYFNEDAKSTLLNILYKIETAYKDYKKVKQNTETKDEYIEKIIDIIQNECEEIKLVKPYSEESKIIGNKTFLVEKNKKRIICHNVERKLLYCISKISKQERIIKNNYFLIDKTLSNLINTGNNINMVEPLRDFNGYSWTTIPREIESVEHNLIYQNLIILVGNSFLNNWIYNKAFVMDYMEIFYEKMEEQYGKDVTKEIIENLEKISILLEVKFENKSKEEFLKIKNEIEDKLEELKDNKKFIENITKTKKRLANEIKNIDETINDKKMLQKEYNIRNEKLPLEKKIFSIRILSKLMIEERERKIEELENLNELLNPQKFVKYKKELKEKEKTLKILESIEVQKDIDKLKLNLQILFLRCLRNQIEKVRNKTRNYKKMYELRYYLMLPYNYEKMIYETEELSEELETTTKKILAKAHKLKVIERLSKNEDINYELLKNLFIVRSINLEEISVKVLKEKDKFFVQIFDENSLEEKYELKNSQNISKRNLEIRLNRKVKIFC